MSVWRFPIVSFALLFTSSILMVAVLLLLAIRAHMRSDIVRALLTSVVLVIFAASPLVVQAITDRETQLLARGGTFAHHGPAVFLAPAFIVAVLVAVACILFRGRRARALVGWRLLFALVCILFASLNTVNFCTPGWCGRYGFPLPYAWWSDAVIIMNGVNLSADTSWMNLFYNVLCLVAVLLLVVRFFRKTHREIAPPPSA